MPYFSVCIPNFNYGRYLGETIQSVLDQTFSSFEILVSDNASTDNSVEVIESFDDDRIHLVRNRYNIGFAPNLQRATEPARGKFMILLSSDDLMRPDALACYYEILKNQGEREEHTVLTSSTDVIDSNGALTMVSYKPPGQTLRTFVGMNRIGELKFDGTELMRGKDVLRQGILQCRSVGGFASMAYPRKLWEAVEGYDTTYQIFPDSAYWHKILALDPDYIWVGNRLFAYRVHGTNQAAQAGRSLKEQVDAYNRMMNYPQSVLDDLGVTRDQMIRSHIRTLFLDKSLGQLSRGRWTQSFKMLAFAFATYPGHALLQRRTYLTTSLLMLGPFGIWLSKIGRAIFHERGRA